MRRANAPIMPRRTHGRSTDDPADVQHATAPEHDALVKPVDTRPAAATYAAQVASLVDGVEPANFGDSVLGCLLARDDVLDIARGTGALSTAEFKAILDADDTLHGQASRIERRIGSATLARWRATRQPPADAWWWHLDLVSERAAERPGWAALTITLLIVAFGFVLDIGLRWMGGGADFLGLFSGLVQSLLVLLVGSSFTAVGNRWARRALRAVGVGAHRFQEGKAAVALLLTVILGLSSWNLWRLSGLYYQTALSYQSSGQVTRALEDFGRAVRLDPGWSAAHYQLAIALEDSLDHDRAVSEYQRALLADGSFVPAYNNLARLLMRERGDFAAALQLLDRALAREPAEPALRYSIYKNRGWAYLGLSVPGLAEADLRQALAIRPSGAAAHCLLAQALEQTGRAEAARPAWEDCLRFERADYVEAAWIATARARAIE